MAAASVAAVVASGAFQSWRQVRSIDALTSTTYGRLLIVKVVAVGAMVALGAFGRQEVGRRWRLAMPAAPGTAPRTVSAAVSERLDVRELRRSVGAEVVLAVAVLVLTSVLVATPPARTALAQPFSATLPAGAISFDLSVDPARTGGSTLHFYALSQAGTIAEVDEMTARLSLPSKDLGPLELPLHRGGPGHFLVDDYPIPLPGDWELEVSARIGTFDQFTARATFTVR
jgi:copper transport protein